MNHFARALTAAVLVVLPFAAQAAVPAYLPIQGYLTDAAGAPIDGEETVVVALYASDTGGTALYEETQTLLVDQGYFTLYVGQVQTLPLDLFAGGQVRFVGLTVGADPEMAPRLALGVTPYAALAHAAEDAGALQGRGPGDFAAADHDHPFSALTGVPAGLADGDDVLTEVQVDAYVANDGYAPASSLAPVATSGAFSDLQSIPPGLSDGDDDTLGGLSCADGLIAKRVAGAWTCAADAQVDPADFIQNQDAVDQPASFRIAGTGAVGTSLLVGTTTGSPATLSVDGTVHAGQVLNRMVKSGTVACPDGFCPNPCPCDFSAERNECEDAFGTTQTLTECTDQYNSTGGNRFVPGGQVTVSVVHTQEDRLGVGTSTPEARLHVAGRAFVDGDVRITGTWTNIEGHAVVRETLTVYGATTLRGGVTVQGGLTVQGTTNVAPAGTWCGLVIDDAQIWPCGGLNPRNGCPAGYQQLTMNTQFGDPTGSDYICVRQ